MSGEQHYRFRVVLGQETETAVKDIPMEEAAENVKLVWSIELKHASDKN